jgi:hypothetical protein
MCRFQGLSEQGNSVLRRALTPEQNYKTARAFVDDLGRRGFLRAQAAPVRAPTFAPPPPLPREKSRPFSVRWFVAAVVMLLTIVGVCSGRSEADSTVAVSQTPEFETAPNAGAGGHRISDASPPDTSASAHALSINSRAHALSIKRRSPRSLRISRLLPLQRKASANG